MQATKKIWLLDSKEENAMQIQSISELPSSSQPRTTPPIIKV